MKLAMSLYMGWKISEKISYVIKSNLMENQLFFYTRQNLVHVTSMHDKIPFRFYYYLCSKRFLGSVSIENREKISTYVEYLLAVELIREHF